MVIDECDECGYTKEQHNNKDDERVCEKYKKLCELEE